jgi:putative membrane protein
MLAYNTKDWLGTIFRFDRNDTLQKLWPLILLICFLTWGIAYLEFHYIRASESQYLKNLNQMHTLLSFAISMLLVFRTNTAYDRWWEGRKHWGTLVNVSRNLAIKLNAFLVPDDQVNRKYFAKLIPMYSAILARHLHAESTRLALDEKEHPELAGISDAHHQPNMIAGLITQRVNKLYIDKLITGDQLILLNNEITSFTDVCGACERIKNTPIPYSYSSFLKKFIVIFVATLPIALAFSLGYYAIPVVGFIFYVLASLELIAEEIEDPFGKDLNDLPIHKMAENIKQKVVEILV